MKESTLKRTLKGSGIGLLAALASFGLIRVPVIGLLAFVLHSPVTILLDSSSFSYYNPLIFAYGTLIGALLGFLRPYKFQFVFTIVSLIILSIGTSMLWVYTFAKTMSEF